MMDSPTHSKRFEMTGTIMLDDSPHVLHGLWHPLEAVVVEPADCAGVAGVPRPLGGDLDRPAQCKGA